jgi:hypothetical protein
VRSFRLALLALALSAAPVQAQGQTEEPTYCGYRASEIPVIRRHPYLTGYISPQVLTAEGLMVFRVDFYPGEGVVWDYTPWPVIDVELRFDTFRLPGTPPGGGARYDWQVSQSNGVTVYTMSLPITLEGQGIYRLQASASYCYKPCPRCSPVQANLSVDRFGAAFIPLPNASMSRFLTLLEREWRKNGQSVEVFVVAPELAPDLKNLLGKMARGTFENCDRFGFCDRFDPVRIQRFLTDVPDAFRDLVATGRLCGGAIPVCYGAQDSRVYDIGPRLNPLGIMIVSGGRHDYIAFGPGLITGGSFYLFEGPKGVGGMLKEALLLALVEKQGREVR